MKKCLGLIAAAALLVCVAGCASTKNQQGVYAEKQAKEQNLPSWALKGTYTDKDGLYGVGSANYGDVYASTEAAKLHARNNIAAYIGEQSQRIVDELVVGSKDSAANTVKIKSASEINQYIAGVRQVDSYTAKDGTVYALLFISNSDLQRTLHDAGLGSIGEAVISSFLNEAQN